MMISYFRYLESIQNVSALIFKLYTTDFPDLFKVGWEEDLAAYLPLVDIKKKKKNSFYLVDMLHFN